MVSKSMLSFGAVRSRSCATSANIHSSPRTARRGRVVVRDKRRAVLTFLMLFAGLGLLLAYIVSDMPGLTAASRRATLVPTHPAAAPPKAQGAEFGAVFAGESTPPVKH